MKLLVVFRLLVVGLVLDRLVVGTCVVVVVELDVDGTVVDWVVEVLVVAGVVTVFRLLVVGLVLDRLVVGACVVVVELDVDGTVVEVDWVVEVVVTVGAVGNHQWTVGNQVSIIGFIVLGTSFGSMYLNKTKQTIIN